MEISKRLKQERERLGLSQTAFGQLGGAGKTTVISWERGTAYPNAAFLAAIAKVGGDVQYILTGVPSSLALAPDERLLVERYRASPASLKDAALRVLLGGVEEGVKPRA